MTLKQFFSHKLCIPLVLFVFILILFLLNLSVTGRNPIINSVSPSVALPGDVLVIQGKFFDDGIQPPEIILSGQHPSSSLVLSWSDTSVNFKVPVDAVSGFIYVKTTNGMSEGKLFTNLNQVPVVVNTQTSELPDILDVEPQSVTPGGIITISGQNFGMEADAKLVNFKLGSIDNWSFFNENPSLIHPESSDIISWSDDQIELRVPLWTVSGDLYIDGSMGPGKSVYIEIDNKYGTKHLTEKKTYSLYYDVNLSDIQYNSIERQGDIYVWFPLVAPIASQQGIVTLNSEPVALIEDLNQSSLYYLADPQEDIHISRTVLFDRYSVETSIDPSSVLSTYNRNSELYTKYTAQDDLISPELNRMSAWGWYISGRETNPYLNAKKIYDTLLSRLEWKEEIDEKDLEEIIDNTREADSLSYSKLFCSMTRAVGIPSRPVAGFYVDSNGLPHRHYWAEFYLEYYGWVPLDPALAEGAYNTNPSQDLIDYSFGNIDNRHIVFSKGLKNIKQMAPNGDTITNVESYVFQSIMEETSGNIESYISEWNDIRINGIYESGR